MKTFTQDQVKVFLEKWGIESSHLRSNHALLDDEEYAEVLKEHTQDKLHGKLVPKSIPMYSEEDKEIIEYIEHVNTLDFGHWVIEIHRAELTESLHLQCGVFCTIGTPIESPRWINIHELKSNEDGYFLKFQSTQTDRIYFHLELTERIYKALEYRMLAEELWEPFKQFRNTFLVANYPTIKI